MKGLCNVMGEIQKKLPMNISRELKQFDPFPLLVVSSKYKRVDKLEF